MKRFNLIPFMFILFFAFSSLAQNADSITNSQTVQDSLVFVKSNEKKNNAPILTIVEQMPSYPGGEEAMYEFLGKNIKYPQYAKENDITGTVIVTYVIEQDGSITDVRTLKDIGGGCGEEAVRVIKCMPKWIPGKQGGAPVRVQFNLPIRYTLDDDEGEVPKRRGCFGIF
jgi:TonB family protein